MKRLLSSLFIIAGIAILVVAVAAWGKSPGKHHRGGTTITVNNPANANGTAKPT